MKNPFVGCSHNDDEVVICYREYSTCILDTISKFEKYSDESEEILTKYVNTSDFSKNFHKNLKINLLEFLLECNSLAQKMAAGIEVVYQKKHNRICASVICDKIVFKQNELETLMKLCAFTSQMSFFTSNDADIKGAVIDFFFDLSGNSSTLANLIGRL